MRIDVIVRKLCVMEFEMGWKDQLSYRSSQPFYCLSNPPAFTVTFEENKEYLSYKTIHITASQDLPSSSSVSENAQGMKYS